MANSKFGKSFDCRTLGKFCCQSLKHSGFGYSKGVNSSTEYIGFLSYLYFIFDCTKKNIQFNKTKNCFCTKQHFITKQKKSILTNQFPLTEHCLTNQKCSLTNEKFSSRFEN